MMLPKVVYRFYSDDDLNELVGFLGEYLWSEPRSKLEELFRWKHLANPFGRSEMALVVCGGKIVTFLAGVPWKLMTGGQVINCLRWTDVVSDPDFRSQGMGAFAPIALATKLTEKARQDRVQLFFGRGPNEYSLPFIMNFGWREVERIWPLVSINYQHVLVSVIKSKSNRRAAEGYEAKDFFKHEPTSVTSLLDHAGFDSLLRKDGQLEDSRLLTTCRTLEYLKWRYVKHPINNYYAVMRERSGELSAAIIFATGSYLGLKNIVVDEIFLSSPEEAVDILNELRATVAADYLFTRLSSGSWKNSIFRKSGFRTMRNYFSSSTRKMGERLLAYSLSQTIPTDPYVGKNWSLSMGELAGF